MTDRSTTTLIFEPDWHGHKLMYVRVVVSRALLSGQHVLIGTSGGAIRSNEWRTQIEEFPELASAQVDSRYILGDTFRTRRRNARSLRNAVCRDEAVRIIVLNADEMLLPLASTWKFRRRRGTMVLVIMRPPSWGTKPRSIHEIAKRALMHFLATNSIRILELRSPFDSMHGSPFPPLVDPVLATRLPLEQYDPIERAKKTALPVVSVLGRLDARKNIHALLQAHELGVARGTPFAVFLGGVPDDVTDKMISDYLSELVISSFGYLSESDYWASLAGSSLICLAYSNVIGSSGVLGQAASLGVPVLGFGNETIVSAIKRFNLGVVATSLEPEALLNGIRAGLLMGKHVSSMGPEVASAWVTSWDSLLTS